MSESSHYRDVSASALRAQVEFLKDQMARISRQTSGKEAAEMEAIQHRFDCAGALSGRRASAPTPGELPIDYRRRLVRNWSNEVPSRFKGATLAAFDTGTLDLVEPVLFEEMRADAQKRIRPGELISETTREGGRDITRFHGDPMSWMQSFMSQSASGGFANPHTINGKV